MANRISQILSLWEPNKDQLDWVLGTVIDTKGPSYRNTGAMIMINSLGHSYGLLSGGCLEADIVQHARKVMQHGKPKQITYDALDEDSAWLLGIGCGGKVEILLQPIHQHNHYQQLDKVLGFLQHSQSCCYTLDLQNNHNPNNSISPTAQQITTGHLQITINPDPTLVIFGGGLDAIPVVNMAHEMGWRTHLIDHRVTHARAHQFKQVNSIHRLKPADILSKLQQPIASDEYHWMKQADAAIVMSHNLSQDAEALNLLSSLKQNRLQYIGLLGPESRKQKVLLMANLNEALLPTLLHGPMGLDIGGELPESIALSILSEIHAVLEGKEVTLKNAISAAMQESK
jgi:xanthine/CO dehydrogenase XdhC/CoxF family maturation factor